MATDKKTPKKEGLARVGKCDTSSEIPHDYVTDYIPLSEAEFHAEYLNDAEDSWTHQTYRVFPEKKQK